MATTLTPEEIARAQRRIRYFGEAEIRLTEIRLRTKNAKHWVRRRDPRAAQDELMHLINEARKLHLHLQAWDNYV